MSSYPIRIRLSLPLLKEVEQAAQACAQDPTGESASLRIEEFCTQCVESVLASRRLERMPTRKPKK